jgi:hypothetical protein
VTEPRDPTFAFHQDFSHGPRAYETVPYGLVGEKMLEMGFPYDFQFERPFVEPTSLLRGQQGALALEVRFTHNGFWGTLVKEGDEWRLVNVQKDFPGGREPSAKQREAAAAMLEAQQRGREETEQLAKPASPAGPVGPAPDEAPPVGGEDAPAEPARAAE